MDDTPSESADRPPQAASVHLPPQARLDKVLSVVPRALSSHVHIIFLGAMGVYLVLLPLVGVNVSAKAELIAATTPTSPPISAPASRRD